MGIHDRDYARPGGPSGGRRTRGGPISSLPIPRRLVGLSITTWIIIINCAVFVFDAMVYKQWSVEVPMGEVYPPPLWSGSALPTITERRGFTIDNGATLERPEPGLAGFKLHPIYRVDPSGKPVVLPNGAPDLVGFQRFVPMPPLKAAGHFSTGKGFSELQVWRLVLFQFLHADVSHIAFNMMGLFFFGPLVERYLASGRRYLAFYLICGIAGALLYLTLNLLGDGFGLRLPGVLHVDLYTPLIGASAGVFGVLLAAAFVAGDEIMLIFGIIPTRVSTGAYIMAGIALANLLLAGRNAGGDAAHVGGALAGWFFIRRPHLLRNFFDFLGPERARPMPSLGQRPARGKPTPDPDRARIDALLDKVHQQGLHSLSDAEKAFLEKMRER